MASFTRSLLRGAEWRDIMDYLSPALFDVISPAAVAEFTSSLLSARVEMRAAARARRARAELLAARGAPIALAARAGAAMDTATASPAQRRARGDAILRLYFHQLIEGGVCLLDLRPERFGAAASPALWRPGWMRHRWRPDFLPAMRGLYAGFYGGVPGDFDAALRALGITPARAIFLGHFGGDQSAVRFEAAHFRETFHAAFVTCRDAGSMLHPDFLPLGIYLATLYAHLEPLAAPLDVRAAWGDVIGAASRQRASA